MAFSHALIFFLQDYVSKMAVLLADANNHPESEAGKEVQVSIPSLAILLSHRSMWAPTTGLLHGRYCSDSVCML